MPSKSNFYLNNCLSNTGINKNHISPQASKSQAQLKITKSYPRQFPVEIKVEKSKKELILKSFKKYTLRRSLYMENNKKSISECLNEKEREHDQNVNNLKIGLREKGKLFEKVKSQTKLMAKIKGNCENLSLLNKSFLKGSLQISK